MRLVGGFSLLLRKYNNGTHIFLTDLIQSSIIFFGPFLTALQKKKVHIVILCKVVLQHMLLIIPLMF